MTDYKAAICLFFKGGNDSYNMLLPAEGKPYDDYVSIRGGTDHSVGGLALSPAEFSTITTVGQKISTFGVHNSLPYVQGLYNEGTAAFVANVGETSKMPITKDDYNVGTGVPVGLFSHSDAQMHWQTAVPQQRGAGPKGWMGRMSHPEGAESLPNNISLSGTNVIQVNSDGAPFICGVNGPVTLGNYDTTTQSFIGEFPDDNILMHTFSSMLKGAVSTSDVIKSVIDAQVLTQTFPITNVGRRLEVIAKIIKSHSLLGISRHTFYLDSNGWDHHNEVIESQIGLFGEVDDAIQAFWEEMKGEGLENSVVLFTESDFARTLTTNGKGSDHAWGGNHFVIGGDVAGGKIYGEYPITDASDFPPDELNVGRGRLIPTTPFDAYFSEIATWFGASVDALPYILPNFSNNGLTPANPTPLGIFDKTPPVREFLLDTSALQKIHTASNRYVYNIVNIPGGGGDNNSVYDFTDWAPIHPGGSHNITKWVSQQYELSYPHDLDRWLNNNNNMTYIGKFNTVVDYDSLPEAIKSVELESSLL